MTISTVLKLAGFDNISIDLIYALPTQTMEQVKEMSLRLLPRYSPYESL